MQPVAVVWSLNIGEVITWLIMIAGLCFQCGYLVRGLKGCAAEIDEHWDSFEQHVGQNAIEHGDIRRDMTLISTRGAKDS